MLNKKNRLLALVALAMALSQGFESCRASGSAMPAYDSDGELYYDALPLAASLVQQPGRSVAVAQKSRVFAMPELDSDDEFHYEGALPLAASLMQQSASSVAASRKSAGSASAGFDRDRDDDVSPVAVSQLAVQKRQRQLERALAAKAVEKRAAHMARIAAEEELSGHAEHLRQEAAARLREREIADAEMQERIQARHRRALEQKGRIAEGDYLIAARNSEIAQLERNMRALNDEMKVLQLRIKNAQSGIGTESDLDLGKALDKLLEKQKSYKDALATFQSLQKRLKELQARKLDIEYYVATGKR